MIARKAVFIQRKMDEKILKYQREWNKNNKDRVIASRKKFMLSHPGYKKTWYKEHAEIERKRGKIRYSINKDYLYNKNKEYYKKHQKEYIKLHPKILLARSIARRIKDKLECEICRKGNGIQKHHPNYNKPLNIVPLCRNCHTELHRLIKK